MRTKLFLDTEFTGLHQKTTLISVSIVSENGQAFYAELTDYDKTQVDDWLMTNVIANLTLAVRNPVTQILMTEGEVRVSDHLTEVLGNTYTVNRELRRWLTQFGPVEIWSDVLAYDWVLLVNLLGGPWSLPENLFYIPFDLATLLHAKHIDPDVNRMELAGLTGLVHNALFDAYVIKTIYQKITAIP